MTAFGIDFGTTNSVLALASSGGVETIRLDDPPEAWATLGFDKVLPTVLAESGGQLVHGWRARRTAGRLEAVKRLFTEDGDVVIGTNTFRVEEAAGIFFREIKRRTAEAGATLDQAVVTVPANSRGKARFRTKVSAGLSGIEVQALLNEPTAAAMAHSRDIDDDHRVLVFDWGGGTLDVTILRAIDGVFVEESSKGVQRLGGLDVDRELARIVSERIPPGASIDPFDLERAKVLLSSHETTSVSLIGGGTLELDRSHVEAGIHELLTRALEPVKQCLVDLDSPSIDHLVMVGGTSKIPVVQKTVAEFLGIEPLRGVDPMTAVAEGAAVAAGILSGEIHDRDFFVGLEHALGTVTHDGNHEARFSVLIGRNTMLPAEKIDVFVPLNDEQETLEVNVIEGDPTKPLDHEDNVILETWKVELPEKRPKNEATVSMKYLYDLDGILHVTLTDVKTGMVLLDEEVRQGAAKDRKKLVEMRRRIDQSNGTGGSAASSGADQQDHDQLDGSSRTIIDSASKKIVPFVDERDAQRIKDLIDALERSGPGEERETARDALQRAVREHAYLL